MSYAPDYDRTDEIAVSAALGDRLPGHVVRAFNSGKGIAVAYAVEAGGERYRNAVRFMRPFGEFTPQALADEAAAYLTKWAKELRA